MAVSDVTSLSIPKFQMGIQITKVTDSSSDWVSVSNSTYFYDKADGLVHYKNSSGIVLELFSATGLTQAYSTIQDEGTPLTQRSSLDFQGSAVIASDDAVNSKTVVTINKSVLSADITTTEVLKACTYNNGTSGVGATLTGNSNGQLATISYTGQIDGVNTALGQVILVRSQASAIQNGLYVVTQLGDALNPFILTRSVDANSTSQMYPLQVNIYNGTFANYSFLQKTVNPTIGVSNITFSSSYAGVTQTQVVFVDTVTSTALPSCTYTSGTNTGLPGSGARLTATSNGAIGTINGITLAVGNRVLVKDEVNQATNGDYSVIQIGTGSTPFILQRVTVYGSDFSRYVKEWKVNNSSSTKFGLRYNVDLSGITNTNVGISALVFQEYVVTDANLQTSDIITNDVSITKHGFAPKAPNDTTKFLRGDGTWATPVSGVSTVGQTDIIYVDSALGTDDTATNRGNIDMPYATVEYVLANVTNTGTVTGDTTSGSATLTNVSSTTNIKVGQYITGTNIPYNSTVISKTSNTIVLSQTATGTGTTLTFTWWTPKLLRLNGDFTATSNWFKQGFYFDSNLSVSVQWGAFNLYEITSLCVIPYINIGEFNYYGTTSTSKWLYSSGNVQTTDMDFTFKFNSIYSNTTSYVMTVGGTGAYYYGNYKISGKLLNAKFGYACTIGWSQQNTYFDITYTYGLLGGVSYDYFQGNGYWNGSITTPASVYAITDSGGSGSSNLIYSNGIITGSVNFNGKSSGATKVPFYSNIVGSTTCSLKGIIMYGNVPDNCILNGNTEMHGYHSSYLYCDAGYNKVFRAPQWGVVSRNSAVVEINADISPYNIQAQGSSKMIINAKVTPGGASVAAGCKLIVNGELNTPSVTLNGEMVNNADTIITAGSITISSTGTLRNYRKIESTVATTTVPLIIKDGGNLYLYSGSYLKVANSKGPLKCSANTSASKDIYLFNTITNCDGSTYGISIAFDGSSYASNDLVGGTKYENTSY
jgi:hypothetical protein